MQTYNDDETMITSAGIIFYRNSGNNIKILMGKTMKTNPEMSKWTILGGRKELTDETLYDTAIREFDEETSGIFEVMLNEVDLYSILKRSVNVRLNDRKYLLFIVSVDDHNLHTYMNGVDERFTKTLNYNLPHYMKEMCAISWMPYTTLFNKSKVSPFVKHGVSRNIDVLLFFNDLYIKLMIDQAKNVNVNYICVYENMMEQARKYIDKHGLVSQYQLIRK
jgi:8-oxo-dGTP pyrophosphatase MutT (NUDIX family)